MTNTLNKIMHNGDEYLLPSWIPNSTDWTTSTVSNIRVGTDTEYWLITPVEWQVSIVYKYVAPPAPRTPWEDTIAYYKFEDDYDDYSWNWYNITSTGSTQLTSSNWLKYLDCNDSFASTSNIDTLTSYSDYTIMAYAYFISPTTPGDRRLGRAFKDGGSRWWMAMVLGPWWWEIRWWNNTNKYTNIASGVVPADQWVHVAVVVLNWEWSLYVNWVQTVLLASWALAPNHNTTPFYVWANQDTNTFWHGYFSKLIIEKKGWTAQEISDYFNQTKAPYWIS